MPTPAQAIKAQNKPSSRDLSAAGLRAFFNIARDWGLNTDEQMVLLGTPGRSTFSSGNLPPKAPTSSATRSSACPTCWHLQGAADPAARHCCADAWVKKPNSAPLFGGKTALDRMLAATSPTWSPSASTWTPGGWLGLSNGACRSS